jgi:CRP-like cAMP-binding protein
MNIFKQLKKCVLFENFEDNEINKIFDSIEARIVKYGRGQLVAKENTEINELCILLEGNLVEFTKKSNGDREVLRSIIDGEVFGLAQGYNKPNFLGYCIVSALDCTVLYITIESIFKNNDNLYNQKLIANLIKAMSGKILELENNNSYITIKGMRLKIAKLIYDNYLTQNCLDISLGMNRNEMAKYLNVSRPSMSREMARMCELGMFDYRKDKILIKDIKALEDIVVKGE